jgi:hypothetical protein
MKIGQSTFFLYKCEPVLSWVLIHLAHSCGTSVPE